MLNTLITYHKGNKDTEIKTAGGSRGDNLKCATAAGYGFSSCIIGLVGISAGASFDATINTNANMWSTKHIRELQCKIE